MRSGSFSQRAYGAVLLVFGLMAMMAPFSAGEWAIAILGLVVLGAGAAAVVKGLQTPILSSTWTTYGTGVLMILGGLLLFARPFMVIGGLLALLALIVAADGVTRIVTACRDNLGQARWWTVLNGIVHLLLALVIWWQDASRGAFVLGVGLGLYIMSTGWTALLAPDAGVEDVEGARATNTHPDGRLDLAPFFQSFMEVRVEGSARRVRLILHGVHGPLRWRDLQISGAMPPDGASPNDPAAWEVAIEGSAKKPTFDSRALAPTQ